MPSFDRLARVATAAVGALVLSTLSVAAAVGPAHSGAEAPAAYAALVNSGTPDQGPGQAQAHG